MSVDVGAPESIAAAVRAAVAVCKEGIDAHDWERAHAAEDQALTLLARAAAGGMDVRDLAYDMLPMLDSEWPRWTA